MSGVYGRFLLQPMLIDLSGPGCIALERCVDQRYRQVLHGHRLSDGQIRDDVRVSERNKATNSCNGGTGQLNWQP